MSTLVSYCRQCKKVSALWIKNKEILRVSDWHESFGKSGISRSQQRKEVSERVLSEDTECIVCSASDPDLIPVDEKAWRMLYKLYDNLREKAISLEDVSEVSSDNISEHIISKLSEISEYLIR